MCFESENRPLQKALAHLMFHLMSHSYFIICFLSFGLKKEAI